MPGAVGAAGGGCRDGPLSLEVSLLSDWDGGGGGLIWVADAAGVTDGAGDTGETGAELLMAEMLIGQSRDE